MSELLDSAATLDPERAAALAANDAAMRGPLRSFLVSIKNGQRVLHSFECLARSSVEATTQHIETAEHFGGYLFVSPVGGAS